MREDIFEGLNNILDEWASEFLRNRIEDAEAKILDVTGQGLRSFDVRVIHASLNSLGAVLLSFQDQLRILDMRKVTYPAGRGDIDQLKEWVRARGVQRFRKTARLGLSETQAINKIAWGVWRSKKKLKRKRWYNKGKERDISRLYGRISNKLSKDVIRALKESAKNIS